jgi:Fic family protein
MLVTVMLGSYHKFVIHHIFGWSQGEALDKEEVRSSVARKLGIEYSGMVHSGRDVEGIVDILADATTHYDLTLSKDRLLSWHSALFPEGRSGLQRITVANWRSDYKGPMRVVSGACGKERVHFQAPEASVLEKEMNLFFTWVNTESKIDPILKAGIAHLWFLTLHPFEDGNGRIGRAIADMLLARADGNSERFYSLSSQIEKEKKEYYKQLELQQRSEPELTLWLSWFLDCLKSSIESAHWSLEKVFYQVKLWNQLNRYSLNERQRFIINRMLDDNFEGHMHTSKYAKMAKCSTDTALRDIQDLKKYGGLIQNSGQGRSTSYRLPTQEEI